MVISFEQPTLPTVRKISTLILKSDLRGISILSSIFHYLNPPKWNSAHLEIGSKDFGLFLFMGKVVILRQ